MRDSGDPRLDALAHEYRERRPRRGRTPVGDYVRIMYDAYRGRRVSRLMAIAADVAALGAGVPAEGHREELVESWELTGGTMPPPVPGDLERDERRRWQATYFDLLCREALNARAWVGDLRLAESQRAVLASFEGRRVLGISVGEDAPLTRFQQRALDALGAVRDAVVSHDDVILVPAEEITSLPHTIRAALGVGDGDIPANAEGDPFDGVRSVGTALPLLTVPLGDGRLLLAEHVEPWHAIAEAQERELSFGDAIATGVLMMSADAGIVTVPPTAISPDGVAEIIERDRQHDRLEAKLARWIGLHTSAAATLGSGGVSRPRR